ncbi:MAG TPA: tol-pal system protein YbgF [Xanthobacteraceae bacterium]
MVENAGLSNMSPGMIRSVSPFVVALACTLWATAAHAQTSDTDLLTRIDRLEATIRDLTGSVQQLQYRDQQLEQQLRQLQAQGQGQGGARPAGSSASRPTAEYSPPTAAPYSPPAAAPYLPPAAAQYSPPATPPYSPPTSAPYSPPPNAASSPPTNIVPPGEPGASSDRRGDAFDPALYPNAPGSPRALGAPGVEPPPVYHAPQDSEGSAPGALPPPNNPGATGAMEATLPPSNTPRDEYDLAYGYVSRKDYARAADTFGAFLRKYPSDRLAPEAQYWLGESLFQTQRYRDAAEAFLTVSTKYDTTAKAPDALLRLGQSLAALGEKEAACASLGEVLRKYPRASLSVKQGVEREQKRVHC